MADAKDQTERRPATAEEAAALANPLRIRILRLCLDRALTNKELAARLGKDPGTTLHHVRKLVATGFLAAEDERRGQRGSVERPYRATGKSWRLDVGGRPANLMPAVDAFRDEWSELEPADVLTMSRLGVRLSPAAQESFGERLGRLVQEIVDADDPEGEPIGIFVAAHKRRDELPIPDQGQGSRWAPRLRPGSPTSRERPRGERRR